MKIKNECHISSRKTRFSSPIFDKFFKVPEALVNLLLGPTNGNNIAVLLPLMEQNVSLLELIANLTDTLTLLTNDQFVQASISDDVFSILPIL